MLPKTADELAQLPVSSLKKHIKGLKLDMNGAIEKKELVALLEPCLDRLADSYGPETGIVHAIKDAAAFTQILAEGGDSAGTLIDFTAQWCGPCKMVTPELEKIAREHPEHVFVKIDVDQSPDLAQQFNVTAMPTFIAWKGGKVLGQPVMGANVAALRQLVKMLAR
jgi:thioredoxin 1